MKKKIIGLKELPLSTWDWHLIIIYINFLIEHLQIVRRSGEDIDKSRVAADILNIIRKIYIIAEIFTLQDCRVMGEEKNIFKIPSFLTTILRLHGSTFPHNLSKEYGI